MSFRSTTGLVQELPGHEVLDRRQLLSDRDPGIQEPQDQGAIKRATTISTTITTAADATDQNDGLFFERPLGERLRPLLLGNCPPTLELRDIFIAFVHHVLQAGTDIVENPGIITVYRTPF